MKTRMHSAGLVLRCATTKEHERILHEIDGTPDFDRVLIIEAGESPDYVIARAVGWQEDDQENHQPSDLAFFMGGTDPTRLLPSDLSTPWSVIQAAQERDQEAQIPD